ncbi:Hypothetical predicted protein [Cloeon dipterum]|uniref:Uncharacterized protein n=1 Tax=Cloeon dipterum TaxID=197152 RepID=A0A8S1DSI1_9INSE|nr:Hypothetical predicted protein [Cloeon dipterum]
MSAVAESLEKTGGCDSLRWTCDPCFRVNRTPVKFDYSRSPVIDIVESNPARWLRWIQKPCWNGLTLAKEKNGTCS